jgi:hypothetical protein
VRRIGEISKRDVTGVHVRDSVFADPKGYHRNIVVSGCLAVSSPCSVLATDREWFSITVFWRVLLGRGGAMFIEADACRNGCRIDYFVVVVEVSCSVVAPETFAIFRELSNEIAEHAGRAL